MSKKYRIAFFIAGICLVEILIYIWATWTTIESQFIFAKCARNSGRAAAALNLIILMSVAYYGIKNIYAEEKKRGQFRILISMFAVNHLIHFFYIFQNFKSQSKALEINHNEHGIVTFIFILLSPIVFWSFKNLNKVLYFGILFYIFNTTYFMIDTFAGRIKPENPAYLHQIGILIMSSFLIGILYRVYREMSISFTELNEKKIK